VENPATIQDVRNGFERPLTDGEATVVPQWLAIAWPRFRRAVPGLEARIALPEDDVRHIDVDEAKAVIAEMVIRRLRNPDALRTWNDDTYGQTIDTELSAGKIYVTDEEKAQFAVPGSDGTNGVYSMQLGLC
jgi:hypothetical protein